MQAFLRDLTRFRWFEFSAKANLDQVGGRRTVGLEDLGGLPSLMVLWFYEFGVPPAAAVLIQVVLASTI